MSAAFQGLTEAQAAARRLEVGPNRIPTARRRSPWAVLGQFTHLMALLLWGGGAVAFAGGLPELGVAIWMVNLINGTFAAWQESRAERAAAALRELLPPRARVVRGGVERAIDAIELVPGDLLVLAEGDRVSADARLADASALEVTESALTGESAAVVKDPAAADERGRVFAGTMVVRGWARAVVEATGAATRVGAIARATVAARPPPSPLVRELRRLTRAITLLALAVGAGFFVLAMAVTELRPGTALLFAIGMVVAFVPEGLLPTVTISLARSTRRMAARHALVRRPSAVEALGATSVICCDKTGTLTEGRMTVAELRSPDEARAGRVMGHCHDLHEDGAGRRETGDPTELALVAAGHATGPFADLPLPRIGAVPFDYQRRRMTTVHAAGAGALVLCKGAPEAVLACCDRALTGGGDAAPLDDGGRARWLAEADAMAARGLRVLGLADGEVP
ncbi:MAG TPA: HAD-IC family P-type ATPase, partial [Kofleriaceae bacterium]|nr:HAD-IC family P-type ATPase [Kofleriaceae bacterium]